MEKVIPFKPENSVYTDGQWQAIYDEGTNILVSASAGSGKTTVLVQRVIEKVRNGMNLDELLVVTYTEAAAKEMKERIRQTLQKAIQEEKEGELKRHFVRQLSLLPTAAISTLHAFCLQVIRRYYYLIEIDPQFRLLTDETETILLKEDVWEEVRERLYAEQQSLFYQLTENFSNDRSDDGLTRLVFSLYDFARSNPDPLSWLNTLKDQYQLTGTLKDSTLYQKILRPQLHEKLRQAQKNAEEMVFLAQSEPDLSKAAELTQKESDYVTQLLHCLEADQLEAAYEEITAISFDRFSGAKRSAPDDVKETSQKVKVLRDRNKKILTDLRSDFFAHSPKKWLELMQKATPLVEEMAIVTAIFDQEFRKRKTEKNVVDFNDLEHFTLNILATNLDGQWQASEAASHYREKFKEVLVDEYQDINQLQESILYWLRAPDSATGNFFMVGDVKQSIYSFRLADPTLFIEKYTRFSQGKEGRRIILAENFRSRKNVLDFTNLIFSQLMDERVGQLTYDQDAQLVNGYKNFPDKEGYDPELLIYETGKEQSDQTEEIVEMDEQFVIDDRTEGELRMVGKKIQELINSKQTIYDKKNKSERPVNYQDIVLLTPTKKNNLVILDIFKELQIPLYLSDTQSYFQATEIRIMVALLHIIDNPYQDIPLVSVLRSPIVGLGENELALIRLQDKEGSYFDALQAYKNADTIAKDLPQLKEKIQHFFGLFEQWREFARKNELGSLIWRIYEETGFLDYVGGLPSGKQRQANLHALYERAASYEEMSYKGLFQFVRFIEKMQEKDKDLAEPTVENESENAVRVMTIHASKGLEFPVVFVLDLTRHFNMMDLRQKYIFDEKLGAGIQYVDTENRFYYGTLPLLAIKAVKKQKLLSEEMRKLYVALTRAEEKLYLVGSYKDKEAAFKEWFAISAHQEVVLPEEARLGSTHLMKWIGMSLARHADMQKSINSSVLLPPLSQLNQFSAHFSVSFFSVEDLIQPDLAIKEMAESTPKQAPLLEMTQDTARAIQRLDFVYPNQLAMKTTSYQSVSEIKRVFEDPTQAELLTLDLSSNEPKTAYRYTEDQLAAPKFLTKSIEVSAAAVGTATHLVLQRFSLTAVPTQESIDNKISELVADKLIEPAVADQINRGDIVQFFMSPLGGKLVNGEYQVKREQPFSMLMNAQQIFKEYEANSEDNILIHGIIDAYLFSKNELILLDFKTDRVTSKQSISEIVAKYRGQLNLYKLALEQATKRTVTSTNIVLLSAGETIEL